MFVDFQAMARELGIRPDLVRIYLGAATRLQRLIRATTGFPSIVALASEFEADRHSTACGPKFEEEEKKEYLEKRAELFTSYLASFNTLEDFKTFGSMISDSEDSLKLNLLSDELTQASLKLSALVTPIYLEAIDSLDKLLELREMMQVYHRQELSINLPENSETGWRRMSRVLEDAFISTLKAASTTEARISILKRMPGGPSELFGISVDFRDEGSRLSFIWTETKTLEEAFLLEDKEVGRFIKKDGLTERVHILAAQAIDQIEGFNGRLAFAREFEQRETYSPNETYSLLLEKTGEVIQTPDELKVLIAIWESRDKKPRGYSEIRWPGLPEVVNQKWDEFYLEAVENLDAIPEIAAVFNSSPYGTKTHKVAELKLGIYFQKKLAQATTEEEVRVVEEDANATAKHLHFYTYTRRDEIRKEIRDGKVNALWERVQRGEHPDEKEALRGLFQHFAKDPVMRQAILIKLAAHYPAESVEVVTENSTH